MSKPSIYNNLIINKTYIIHQTKRNINQHNKLRSLIFELIRFLKRYYLQIQGISLYPVKSFHHLIQMLVFLHKHFILYLKLIIVILKLFYFLPNFSMFILILIILPYKLIILYFFCLFLPL
jgi:hypothetical protein